MPCRSFIIKETMNFGRIDDCIICIFDYPNFLLNEINNLSQSINLLILLLMIKVLKIFLYVLKLTFIFLKNL